MGAWWGGNDGDRWGVRLVPGRVSGGGRCGARLGTWFYVRWVSGRVRAGVCSQVSGSVGGGVSGVVRGVGLDGGELWWWYINILTQQMTKKRDSTKA